MTITEKPLIVGEMNPYGADPYYALYPAPDGCSGHRLCSLILGMHRKTYLESFDRVNLCDGKWSMPAARKRAQELFTYKGKIIALGAKVARAFEFNPFEPFVISSHILVLPHPSGLCRLWHEPGAFEKARLRVAELCPELMASLGIGDQG